MSRRVLVDAGIFLYALGADHPLKQPCRRALADTDLDLHASVELVQEVVFHRMRVTSRPAAFDQAQRVAASCRLLAFDERVLEKALGLIDQYETGGRDAIHAATALTHGIGEILSHDSDFDGIEGLRRVDPRSL